MATIEQINANRLNSQLSTGPRTAAGKQRSSLNALRHGLTAASPVLPSEDPAAYQRHCRQFQKSLDQLREIQAERRLQHARALKRAAALLELQKHRGLAFDPAQHVFVFSKDEIEAHAQRLMRLNESRQFEHVLFHMQPPIRREAARAAQG